MALQKHLVDGAALGQVAGMLDVPLFCAGPLTTEFARRGLTTFAAAAEYVRKIPYGRHPPSDSVLMPLHAHRGTCSSKHRLLAALACELGRTDIVLMLGLYEMSERNTPGVGVVLADAGLKAIPEAHCYLMHGATRLDYTGLPAGIASPFDSLIDERPIRPELLPTIKEPFHRSALRHWALSLGINPKRAWDVRERCIEHLAKLWSVR
jgi:hypothetical protein